MEPTHFREVSLTALVAGPAAAARPPRPGDRGADGQDTERVGLAHLRRDEEEGHESRSPSLARNYLTTSFLFIHFAGGAEAAYDTSVCDTFLITFLFCVPTIASASSARGTATLARTCRHQLSTSLGFTTGRGMQLSVKFLHQHKIEDNSFWASGSTVARVVIINLPPLIPMS